MEDNETIVIDVQLNEEDIASRLAEINQKMAAVASESKAMKQAIKEATEGIQESEMSIAENSKKLGELKAQQEATAQEYAAVGGQIQALAEEYDRLTQSSQQDAAAIAATADAIDQLKLKQQDLVSEMNTYDLEIQEVNQTQADLQAEITKYKDIIGGATLALTDNAAVTKALKSEQGTLEGQIKKLTEKDRKYADSLKGMKAELSALKDQYASLSAAERESAEGKDLLKHIADLDQEIKEVNQTMGDFHDNVGNYPGAVAPVSQQIKELTQALIEMRVAGQENTEEYQQMLQKVGELKDAMGDAQQEIKNMASDTSNLDSVLQGAQTTAGLFSTALGVMNLMGAEDSETSKELAEAQKKLQAAIAITTGLQSVQNALQKNSALMMGIQKIQALAAAKAQDALAAATGRATIAQRIFNTVAKANPYVLLATAILSVLGALVAFTMGQKETEEQTKKVNDELSEQIKVIKALRMSYEAAYNDEIQDRENEIELLKAKGASIEEIRDKEDELYSLQAANFAQQKEDYKDIIDNIDTYKEQVETLSTTVKENADKQHEMYADLEALQKGYFINFSKYPMLLGKARDEQLAILQGMYDTHVLIGQEAIEQMESIQNNIRTAESIIQNEENAINKRNIQLETRRKEDQKRAQEAAKKAEEIAKKRNDELNRLDDSRRKYQIEQEELTNAATIRSINDALAEKKKELATNRKLTLEERANLNKEIIEMERDLRVKELTLANAVAAEKRQLEFEQYERGQKEKLAELKRTGVLTDEIERQILADIEEQRSLMNRNIENDAAELASSIAQIEIDAAVEAGEIELQLKADNYQRQLDMLENMSETRRIMAKEDAAAVAQIDYEEALAKQYMLLNMDEETKSLLYASESEYVLALTEANAMVEESYYKVTKAIMTQAATYGEAMNSIMNSIGGVFDAMMEGMDEESEEFKAMARAQALMSFGEIGVQMAVGLAKAISAGAGLVFPANLAAIAAGVAAVASGIAGAISTYNKYKDYFAEGGIVGGDKYKGDKLVAHLNSGEMVLNKEQQARLFQLANQSRVSDQTQDFDQMVEAFGTALENQPQPILDYAEFQQFTKKVDQRNSKVSMK